MWAVSAAGNGVSLAVNGVKTWESWVSAFSFTVLAEARAGQYRRYRHLRKHPQMRFTYLYQVSAVRKISVGVSVRKIPISSVFEVEDRRYF